MGKRSVAISCMNPFILVLIASQTLLLSGCDTATKRKTGDCLEHGWLYKGAYKVEQVDGLRVTLIKIDSSEKLEISAMDKGWREVSCTR